MLEVIVILRRIDVGGGIVRSKCDTVGESAVSRNEGGERRGRDTN